MLITGTPQFFDGAQGVRRLAPLAQRLHTDFARDPRFDSARAIQVRLSPFSLERMLEVGRQVRALYPGEEPARIAMRVDDAALEGLARAVAGKLGGQVGIAPRIFLKRLVGLLDQVDEHPDFDPAKDYDLVLDPGELTTEERAAAGVAASAGVDDIALDLSEDS